MRHKRYAVLDEAGVLIGSTNVEGLEIGDLITDGRYRWDAEKKRFIPLGHDLPQITQKSPLSTEHLLALVIEHLEALGPPALDSQLRNWLSWFDGQLRRREEERAKFRAATRR